MADKVTRDALEKRVYDSARKADIELILDLRAKINNLLAAIERGREPANTARREDLIYYRQCLARFKRLIEREYLEKKSAEITSGEIGS